MSEEKFVIKSELTTKATAALNQSVSEDLKEKDRPIKEIIRATAIGNGKVRGLSSNEVIYDEFCEE